MATGKLICKRLIQAACIVLIAGCFCYGYARLGRNTLPQVALPNPHQLQVGDWIFRSGHHADSLLIKRLSHSNFSHVGIVVQTQPTVQIAHATTDDNANLPDQVLLTPLHEFLSPKMADAVAVARPRFLSPANALKPPNMRAANRQKLCYRRVASSRLLHFVDYRSGGAAKRAL